MKPFEQNTGISLINPAAFGRLCVETKKQIRGCTTSIPAAFGRLCVETIGTQFATAPDHSQPPSGGCVLKPTLHKQTMHK